MPFITMIGEVFETPELELFQDAYEDAVAAMKFCLAEGDHRDLPTLQEAIASGVMEAARAGSRDRSALRNYGLARMTAGREGEVALATLNEKSAVA